MRKSIGLVYSGEKEYRTGIQGCERAGGWYIVVGRSMGLRYMGKKDHGAGILWWEVVRG